MDQSSRQIGVYEAHCYVAPDDGRHSGLGRIWLGEAETTDEAIKCAKGYFIKDPWYDPAPWIRIVVFYAMVDEHEDCPNIEKIAPVPTADLRREEYLDEFASK